MNHLTDEELMTQFIDRNNTKAFEVLYHKYFVLLAKYLGWLSGNMELGKDIAQSTFLKVLNKSYVFNTKKSFKVWLYVIAKNNWLNEQRKLDRYTKEENTEPSIQEDLFDTNNEVDQLQRMNVILNTLSELHRETFVLKYLDNLSIQEIAETMDCSEGTVKSRLFYAMKNMRSKMKEFKTEYNGKF
ncbi:RNA polymerase sigma factor [Flammeovirga sp. EKP202]|uniref:RNA polymerase sigma factor n=1 Tax=Flammeovirga sp. EKP202 TaxID=2770592 RepID=UPI00165F92D5|nr:RNA polymerase sigma factor [Flammeovirga sp. EKP202]MBD0404441.1 RNA polymerase sigma factor [Flammeovirga sp. EKP202]